MNQLKSYKAQVSANSEVENPQRTAFSIGELQKHLVHFIVANDQVNNQCSCLDRSLHQTNAEHQRCRER